MLRIVSFHKSCKCGCLLDEKVCNNKQKWNKNKCRWECLKIENCNNCFSWNVFNCRCESKRFLKFKEVVKLISTEECDIETDAIVQNKTIVFIKKIEFKIIPESNSTKNCKP